MNIKEARFLRFQIGQNLSRRIRKSCQKQKKPRLLLKRLLIITMSDSFTKRASAEDTNDSAERTFDKLDLILDQFELIKVRLDQLEKLKGVLIPKVKLGETSAVIGQSTETEDDASGESEDADGGEATAGAPLQNQLFPFEETTELSVGQYEQQILRWKSCEATIDSVVDCEIIAHPSKEAEKAAIAYVNGLRFKNNKTQAERDIIKYNELENLPSDARVKSFPDLFSYLSMILYLKVKYVIADVVLRPRVKSSCMKVDDPDFHHLVRAIIDDNKLPHHPVKYLALMRQIKMKTPRTETSDIIADVKSTVSTVDDVGIILETISLKIEEFVDANDKQNISDLNWIQIWRILNKDLNAVFKKVLEVMANYETMTTIKMLATSDETVSYVSASTKIDHLSLWKEFAQTFVNKGHLLGLQKLKKSNSNKDKLEKSKEQPKKGTCNICGKAGHFYRNCNLKAKMVEKYKIGFKNGAYIDDKDKKYPLEKGESLMKKYNLALEEDARPSSGKN